MNIDQLLAAASQAQSTTPLAVPGDWSQGRTAFGGLSAAMLYQAMRQHVEPKRVLRSMNTSFIGPLLVDQPFHIETEVLRQGGNSSQVLARAVQDGNTVTMVQACFGVARNSEIVVENSEQHQLAAPTQGQPIHYIPGVTPEFLQHINFSAQQGDLPFTGSRSSTLGGWMRFATAPEKITDAHLITLIDAWPPTLLQMMKSFAPASTMTWNLEFIHPHSDICPTDWFAYEAHTRQAADGYGHTEATIWDSQGEVVALSRQTVAIFG